jgi:hypothetical protein
MRELNKIDGRVATTGAATGTYPSAWLSLRGATAEPSTRSVVLASVLGGGLGALAAATMFPALPALMFGAAIGAYSGFLAAAMEALGSGDLPD